MTKIFEGRVRLYWMLSVNQSATICLNYCSNHYFSILTVEPIELIVYMLNVHLRSYPVGQTLKECRSQVQNASSDTLKVKIRQFFSTQSTSAFFFRIVILINFKAKWPIIDFPRKFKEEL